MMSCDTGRTGIIRLDRIEISTDKPRAPWRNRDQHQ